MSAPLPRLLNVSETAEILGLSEQTVRSHLKAGQLPGRRIGNRWYISADRLSALFEGAA